MAQAIFDDSVTKDGYSGRLGIKKDVCIEERKETCEGSEFDKRFYYFINWYCRQSSEEFGVGENKCLIRTIKLYLTFGGIIDQSNNDVLAYFEYEVDDIYITM